MCYRILIVIGYKFQPLGSKEHVVLVEMKPTRIIEGRWTIVHRLEINPILEHELKLRIIVKDILSRPVIDDVKSIYTRINIILDHVKEICNHLNIQSRVKRGLINGLGSIIKLITGNLDQDDLNTIQKDLETLRVAYNKQISITDETLEEYNKQIKKISDVQIMLQSRILKIVGNKTQQQIALTILLQAQTLQDVAERLITAITFAEHKMYHYSIIQSHILSETVNAIPKNVMISNNINDIEQFIQIYCKIIDNIVYFIIQIPLVKPQVYNTRKIVPIIQNFPTCTYPIMRKVILASTDLEIYEVEHCVELQELICKESILQRDDTCETELLRKKEANTCSTVSIKCPEEDIQEISPKAIYLYLNKTTEVKVLCGDNEETVWVKGSYILSGENCELSISGVKRFRTKESTERIIFTSLELTKHEDNLEMDLSYDSNKISSKLKQMQQIRGLQTQKIHNEIQYGLITFLSLMILLNLICTFCRSKTCSKSWTSNLREDSQRPPISDIHNKIDVCFETRKHDVNVNYTKKTPWTTSKEKQPL